LICDIETPALIEDFRLNICGMLSIQLVSLVKIKDYQSED